MDLSQYRLKASALVSNPRPSQQNNLWDFPIYFESLFIEWFGVFYEKQLAMIGGGIQRRK